MRRAKRPRPVRRLDILLLASSQLRSPARCVAQSPRAGPQALPAKAAAHSLTTAMTNPVDSQLEGQSNEAACEPDTKGAVRLGMECIGHHQPLPPTSRAAAVDRRATFQKQPPPIGIAAR